MGKSPGAGPFAYLDVKLDVDTSTPISGVWLPGIFPDTIDDQGNDIIERVSGQDGQFRVLRDGFYEVRFQVGVLEAAGDREYNGLRVLVNGNPVPGMERVHYIHAQPPPSSACIEGSVRLVEGDIISTEVISYIDTNTYLESHSRLEIRLLHLL